MYFNEIQKNAKKFSRLHGSEDMRVQAIKRKIRLEEWSGQIQRCKDSGMAVSAWCDANGIKKSTYYSRQRAVAEALNGEIEVHQSNGNNPTAAYGEFVEYKSTVQSCRTAITLHLNYGTLAIHNGADSEIIRNTLLALKSIC